MVEIFEEHSLYANFLVKQPFTNVMLSQNVAAPPVIQKIIRKFLFKYHNLRKWKLKAST